MLNLPVDLLSININSNMTFIDFGKSYIFLCRSLFYIKHYKIYHMNRQSHVHRATIVFRHMRSVLVNIHLITFILPSDSENI